MAVKVCALHLNWIESESTLWAEQNISTRIIEQNSEAQIALLHTFLDTTPV